MPTVAVVEQVLRGDGAAHVGTAVEDEVHALLRRDVLHDNL